MGLSAVQLGILKRYFVVVHEQEVKETFKTYVIINPKITSNSQEIIYVDEGEGCLSVNRDVEGIVKRYARCTVEGFDMDALKSLAETLYETKINAGLSPEQARNEIKNIEPFNNFEELIDSL